MTVRSWLFFVSYYITGQGKKYSTSPTVNILPLPFRQHLKDLKFRFSGRKGKLILKKGLMESWKYFSMGL
jgi:hypothetical protein